MASREGRDYLDLLVLIQEFGLPPNLVNDNFTNFEINGRQSEIRIDYKMQLNNVSFPPDIVLQHPLYKGIHQTMQGYYLLFWMTLEHKDEDLQIQRSIHDAFALPE